MTRGDDFKNFFVIQKIEEENENKTIFEIIIKNKLKIFIFFILLFLILLFYNMFLKHLNIVEKKFQINNGESVNYVALNLKDEGIIKSPLLFKIAMRFFGKENVAQAGIYKFTNKDNLLSVINKIKNAKYSTPPVKITIPEGNTNEEIADILSKAFSEYSDDLSEEVEDFSYQNVLNILTKENQGFLFPETYFFLPNNYLSQIIQSLKYKSYDNLQSLFSNISLNQLKKDKDKEKDKQKDGVDFDVKIYSNDLKDIDLSSYFDEENKKINESKKFTIINDIGTTTLSIKDIIIMASYLEGEANNEKDMKIVSGVLWTRLKIGYYLQIDAATSTYKVKGLTKNPINNPGMIAIKAAMSPINTGYLYYLTGKDGQMYYAKDYDTHLLNIRKYLR